MLPNPYSRRHGLSLAGGALTGPLLFADGSAGVPSIARASDPDHGIFFNASGNLAFSDDGTEYFSVNGNSFAASVGGTGRAAMYSWTVSETVPGWTFVGDEDTGMGRAALDVLSLIAGGVEAMRLGTSSITIGDGAGSRALDITKTTSADVGMRVKSTATNGTVSIQLDRAVSGVGDAQFLFYTGGVLEWRLRMPNGDSDLHFHDQVNGVDALVLTAGVAPTATFGGGLLLPDGTQPTPAIAFTGDVDMGLYRAGNLLGYTIAGSARWYFDAGVFRAAIAAGPQLLAEAATATNPTLGPNRADADTGVGWVADDIGALIAGGVNALQWDSSGLIKTAGQITVVAASVSNNALLVLDKTANAWINTTFSINVAANTGIGDDFMGMGPGSVNALRVFGTNQVAIGDPTLNLPDGSFHVHTATAGAVTASANFDEGVFENSADGGISILTPDLSNGALLIGSPSANNGAGFLWQYDAGVARVFTTKVGGSLQLEAGNQIPNLTLAGAAGAETATFAGQALHPDGTLALPAIVFLNDLDTGIYRKQANVGALVGNGVIGATWSGSGIQGGDGTAGSPTMLPEIASATNPVHSFTLDTDTGLGKAGADQLSLIAGGVESSRFLTKASGVNYITFTPAATGANSEIGIGGTDTNSGLDFKPKGNGNVQFKDSAGEVQATIGGAGFRLYGNLKGASANFKATTPTTLSAVSGASVTASSLIPAGALVLGVATKITTALGVTNGTTGYNIGDGTDFDRWGAITGTADTTTSDHSDYTSTTVQIFTAANDVVLTAVGGDFNGTGAIEIIVFYLDLTALTS